MQAHEALRDQEGREAVESLQMQLACSVDVLAVWEHLNGMEMNSARDSMQPPGNLRKERRFARWQQKGDGHRDVHLHVSLASV